MTGTVNKKAARVVANGGAGTVSMNSHRALMVLSVVLWALTIMMTSCAPVPRAGGYADADWCRHGSGGGGDGSGG